MSITVFLIGISLTTLTGWLSVGLAESKTPILTRMERLVFGLILGPTLSMFAVLLSHIAGITNLDLIGFLVPILLLVILLAAALLRNGGLRFSQGADPQSVFIQSPNPRPKWMSVTVTILLVWTLVKVLVGSYDIIATPTYWDDAFNNWNMRGKMFFVEKRLVLEIPVGNGIVQSAGGVSSYPPMLPMMKTWLSVLRGAWHEPLVNSVHAIWFLGLIAAFYLTLRRLAEPLFARFGVYLLVSLPLLLIQGSNPYADVFLASHLFLCAVALAGLAGSENASSAHSFSRLFFLSLGLLALTKNEGLLLHTPILLLAAAWTWLHLVKSGFVSRTDTKKFLVSGFVILLIIVGPWLIFKWTNGLTFGNAKSVSGISIAFNPNVLHAIWFHFTHEANWLFLPLTFLLSLAYAGRRFFSSGLAPLAFIVVADATAQFAIFLFVPSLANEAILQTGLSRGLLHLAPVTMLVVIIACVGSFDVIKRQIR